MRHSENRPQVHAGSMADIAFLLLIFFLVTTTIPNEKGITRKLPPPCPTNDCDVELNERNVLRILVNQEGKLLVNTEETAMASLGDILKKFIDNNGAGNCSYCKGNKDIASSDHPSKAAISLGTHRNSPYVSFIGVQDEITKAYLDLRTKYAQNVFKKPIVMLNENEMNKVREAYPFVISEAAIE